MYSVIDIESNGGAFREECIIEVAIYRYDGHKIVDQFISMVNPEADISHFVQKLTGITPKMVKTAPKFHEIAKRIIEITKGSTLVGHNVDFDYRMLRQSFKRLGYHFSIETLDTIPLAKKLIPNEESYSLGKLVKSLGIPLAEHHRASSDARATLDLFKLLMTKDKDNEIIQSHFEEANAKTYLNKVKTLTQDLPAERGIIYFQDASGKVILAEATDGIYKFAKKIFNAKSKKWQKIQNEVEQISYELVVSELFAKLIMNTKGLAKKIHLPYGLFFENDEWLVKRVRRDISLSPMIKFKTHSQGRKVLNFIKNHEVLSSKEALEQFLSFKDKSMLLTGQGRTRGEKSFLLIEKGQVSGYGFYDWYHQISTYDKLSKLKIRVDKVSSDLKNEIKLALLRNEFKKQEIPS
ncbi:3'-5' exonuclease [Riemerella anatipestifer]|uniref:3'-5' exonuclease n=1 Tax=Riemerella anatipestifer TaxID=34085 RepID=UPI00129EAB1E|nr:3'-5' exonuclease [Riemerella anatipestifer]MBT0525790.1 3'-5' exonuclease [Riemerella anatipestifer]MBT0527633.1 3'-5' exonuclease [Riemerella anatipestifer]MBT0529673.1 3'-5' exonuclease [Riemerella anatipestifer]MBT0531581.1 3'-5' exonuclease [Riemerella anatipestifer]MBT0535331.1 3'-5' exonuclease [Riemerella anatipestifer]